MLFLLIGIVLYNYICNKQAVFQFLALYIEIYMYTNNYKI